MHIASVHSIITPPSIRVCACVCVVLGVRVGCPCEPCVIIVCECVCGGSAPDAVAGVRGVVDRLVELDPADPVTTWYTRQGAQTRE